MTPLELIERELQRLETFRLTSTEGQLVASNWQTSLRAIRAAIIQQTPLVLVNGGLVEQPQAPFTWDNPDDAA